MASNINRKKRIITDLQRLRDPPEPHLPKYDVCKIMNIKIDKYIFLIFDKMIPSTKQNKTKQNNINTKLRFVRIKQMISM